MAAGPQLFRIEQPFEGRLAVSERPLGFVDLKMEAADWRAAGVGAVVSMLEAEEAEDLGLVHEDFVCGLNGIDFFACPISDRGIPDDELRLIQAVDWALAHLAAGRHVAAHCFAGIGRSPLFVASVLVRNGLTAVQAWERVRKARGLQVPDTRAQSEWVASREALLQRR